MKVYIQQINNQFADDWVYAAYLGFSKLGMNIIFFEDVNEIPKHKDNIVIAFVEDTIKHFNKWSMCPFPLNIHSSIEKYYKRKTSITTMGELRKKYTLPLFIKPYSQIKQFDSGVITKPSSLSFFNNIHDNTKIFTSEVVDILSEYRCFIYKEELIGLQWYAGDFTLFPNIQIIKSAINDFNNSNTIIPTTQSNKPPIAYTMDFGVTATDTILIECNDAWSIGNYGLEAKVYAKMLRDRWIEIFRNFDN